VPEGEGHGQRVGWMCIPVVKCRLVWTCG